MFFQIAYTKHLDITDSLGMDEIHNELATQNRTYAQQENKKKPI